MSFDLRCRPEQALDLNVLTTLNESFRDALNESGFSVRLSDANCPDVLVNSGSLRTASGSAVEAEDVVRILGAAGIEVTATGPEINFCLVPLVTSPLGETLIRGLAAVIVELLLSAKTFIEWTPSKVKGRARVSFDSLKLARHRLAALGATFEETPHKAILLSGPTARLAVDYLTPTTVANLRPGEAAKSYLLRPDGTLCCEAIVSCVSDTTERQRFAILPPEESREEILLLIQALVSGVVVIRDDDPAAGLDAGLEVTLGTDAAGKRAILMYRQSRPAAFPPNTKASDRPALQTAHFHLAKPYFMGQEACEPASPPLPEYKYQPAETPLRRTVLYETHKKLGGKIVPFAGWEMPVQYPTGIFAEHRATRTAAGLFDVSHMSAFDFIGSHALAFLESVLAGRVAGLPVGKAAYNYLLYPNGVAMDDTYVYRIDAERYMLVVNAANAAEDFAWISAAATGQFAVDLKNPGKQLYHDLEIRNLREAGEDSLLDIAFQGPKSRDVLALLAASDKDRETLKAIDRNGLAWVDLTFARILVARTGYAGEPIGYELFVHPDKAVTLWEEILRVGGPLGVLPTGLGARDAARLEAGLPLFGHELEGGQKGTLTQISYGWVPKLHVPWFVGRDAYCERIEKTSGRKLVRLAGQGAKSARDGHLIMDGDKAVGVITSFVYLDEQRNFMALAFVPADFDDAPGRKIFAARIKEPPKPGEDIADKLVEMTVLRRYPDKAERERWRAHYGA